MPLINEPFYAQFGDIQGNPLAYPIIPYALHIKASGSQIRVPLTQSGAD